MNMLINVTKSQLIITLEFVMRENFKTAILELYLQIRSIFYGSLKLRSVFTIDGLLRSIKLICGSDSTSMTVLYLKRRSCF